MNSSRIANESLRARTMSAQDAASLITPGSTIGMSGFTGSGYPKAVPLALAARIEAEHAAGNPFRVRIWTGASTGPELDGALAKADGIEFRLPYNSDPIAREKINRGEMDYFDMHLSQVVSNRATAAAEPARCRSYTAVQARHRTGAVALWPESPTGGEEGQRREYQCHPAGGADWPQGPGRGDGIPGPS
jgi:hypothetical protein